MAAFIRFLPVLLARPAPMLVWIAVGILGLAAMGRLAPEPVEWRLKPVTTADKARQGSPRFEPSLGRPPEFVEPPPPQPRPQPPVQLEPGAFHFWSRADGNPQTFLIGKVRLTITTEPEVSNTRIRIEAPGLRTRTLEYDAALGLSFAVGRLDMARRGPQVVVVRRNSGFSCCVALDLATPVGGGWRSRELGRWSDVGVGDRLTDHDGDGSPEFAATDMDYYQQFHAYGRWSSPEKILQIRNGKLVDISKRRAFAARYSRRMEQARKGCVADHDNSSCAAFVAIAARQGRFAWAWKIMLKNYDREQPWSARCVKRRGKERCSNDPSDWRQDFPAALREGLEHTGYL